MAAEAEQRKKSSAALQELAASLEEREFSLTAQRSQVGQIFFLKDTKTTLESS